MAGKLPGLLATARGEEGRRRLVDSGSTHLLASACPSMFHCQDGLGGTPVVWLVGSTTSDAGSDVSIDADTLTKPLGQRTRAAVLVGRQGLVDLIPSRSVRTLTRRVELGDLRLQAGQPGRRAQVLEVLPGDVSRELGVGRNAAGEQLGQRRIAGLEVTQHSLACALLGLLAHAIEHGRIDTLDDGIGGAPQQRDQGVGGDRAIRRGPEPGVKRHHVEVTRPIDGLPDIAEIDQEAFEAGDIEQAMLGREREGEQDDLGVVMRLDQSDEAIDHLVGIERALGIDHEHRPMQATELAAATSEGTQAELLDDLALVAVVDRLHGGFGRWPVADGHRVCPSAYPRRVPAPNESTKVDRLLGLALLILVALRLAYHATYLGEVPFAHGTFSDGAVYEASARDIVEHPPWGTEPFYLQGAYAYLLAIGMAIRPWASAGLLVQLLLAAVALVVAHRGFVRLWGRQTGRVTTILLLACPALAFYENKFLSASLGVACNVFVFAAFVALVERERADEQADDRGGAWWRAGLLGVASGLAILARPNMVLALPFTLVALLVLHPGRGLERARAALPSCVGFVLGLLLALAPMAARNSIVTGHPDLQPIHGGGTSFYIGNNPEANGLWNDAGLLSARLGTERSELVEQLGIDPQLDVRGQARAVGDELYGRAFTWMRAHPADWLALETRKLWFTFGDQQLTQDYDWLGERELIPWANRIAVPFGVLLALALIGAVVTTTTTSSAWRRALAWWLVGQAIAMLVANLLFFTSAQHRLPLIVPLVILAGPGAVAVVQRPRLAIGWWIAALVLIGQGMVPRIDRATPHPVHYYNLAVVQDEIGEPLAALHSLDRAIELRPHQAIFRGERAHLRVRVGDLDGADRDLEVVFAAPDAPTWVLERAALDRATLAWERHRLRASPH
jgi:4-amino-4-deoxy-L-arabinose transferase-like glycosyltransferase